MADIAVVGTAAVDVVLRVEAVPQRGQHVSSKSHGWRLGGGSAIVASALAALGHRVAFLGPVGEDAMGGRLLAELARLGVDTHGTFRVPEPTPRALILLDATGERTIVGIDDPFSRRVYPRVEVPKLGPVDALYLESYARFPLGISERVPASLIVTTPPPAAIGPWPADVLVGSERDYPPAWANDPFAAGRQVAGSRLRWVVITRGARGADAYGARGVVHAEAPQVTQVDATGAGDAFAAGLLSALVAGRSIEDALAAGTAEGARSAATMSSIVPEALEALDPAWPGD